MPAKSAHVKNERQYEALRDKGMSKEHAARIANSPDASHKSGKSSGSGGNARQGGDNGAGSTKRPVAKVVKPRLRRARKSVDRSQVTTS